MSEISELIKRWRIQANVREKKIRELESLPGETSTLDIHITRAETLRECANELESALMQKGA